MSANDACSEDLGRVEDCSLRIIFPVAPYQEEVSNCVQLVLIRLNVYYAGISMGVKGSETRRPYAYACGDIKVGTVYGEREVEVGMIQQGCHALVQVWR